MSGGLYEGEPRLIITNDDFDVRIYRLNLGLLVVVSREVPPTHPGETGQRFDRSKIIPYHAVTWDALNDIVGELSA